MERQDVTAEYYPDKVSIEKFFEILSDVKAVKAFKENMTNLGNSNDKYPEEWADLFIRWMELNPPTNSIDFTTYEILECKHKIYATSGCTMCWHCPKCGRHGCDNLAGIASGIKVVVKKCEHDC